MERVQNLRAEAFEVCDVASDDDEVVNQRGRGYQRILVDRIRPPLHEAGVASQNGGVRGDDGTRIFELVGPNFDLARLGGVARARAFI